MTIRGFRIVSMMSAAAVALASSVASAQIQVQPQERTPGAAAERPTMVGQGDLAGMLKIKHQAEVELSEFAKGKLQNEEARQFAEKMHKEHQQLAQRFERFARDVPRERREAAREPVREGVREPAVTRRGPADEVDLLLLFDRVSQRNIDTFKEELDRKEGRKFDKAFLGGALISHQVMLNAHKEFQQHATGELRSAIDESIGKIESHLDHARKLCDKMEDDNNNDN